MRFLNPLPNGKMSDSMFSKTVEFTSYNSDTIICPESGVVISSDNFKCGGNIKIEHFVDGNTYYSEFCGVDRIMSFIGQQVNRGEIIGTIGDSPLKYSITDKNGSKLDVSDFLMGITLGATTSREEKKDVKKKEETKKEKEGIFSLKSRDRSSYDSNNTPANPFVDALILPFHLLKSIRMKENSENSNEVLKEEISEIKKLINY